MKERIISVGLMIVIILFIPIFITSVLSGLGKEEVAISNTQVKIFYNNKEETIDLEEYIEGVVAAEMPISFEIEALKAQAVAARTFTLKKMEEDPDIVFSSAIQSYYSEEEIDSLWDSEDYPINYAKLMSAVNSTKDEVIVYNNELIDAVFHSTSAGETVAAMDVWGEDIPYLQSVESSDDLNAPSYLHIYSFSTQDFISILDEYGEGVAINQMGSIDVQIIERNSEGYVKEIQIGNRIYEGQEFRNLYALASSNFTISVSDGQVNITCKGYGHGVGMSQYGANFMAEDGFSYDEILRHYYTGCELKQ
jgi:stage II sporulation protein D